MSPISDELTLSCFEPGWLAAHEPGVFHSSFQGAFSLSARARGSPQQALVGLSEWKCPCFSLQSPQPASTIRQQLAPHTFLK